MSTCVYCGEEIEFRWIDGGRKPIHSSGWCSGHESDGAGNDQYSVSVRPIPPTKSSARWSMGHARCDLGAPLTHPTICPICGGIIFFHTNGCGDCVFFDELGPPWHKHACLSNNDGIRAASRSRDLMMLVDRVILPTHISPPKGLKINDFVSEMQGVVVIGVVLSINLKKVWRSQLGTAIRQPMQVQSIIMQDRPNELFRMYAADGIQLHVGQLIQLVPRKETFDGRSALFVESDVEVVLPEKSLKQGRT